MIEEVHAVAEHKERLLEEERKRKEEEEAEKKKQEEKKKAAAAKRAPLTKRTSQMPAKKTSRDEQRTRDSSVGRKESQDNSTARSRSLSRGRENSKDTLGRSPARPGMAKRTSSKSPART